MSADTPAPAVRAYAGAPLTIRCPHCGRDPNGPPGEIDDPPGPPIICRHGVTK